MRARRSLTAFVASLVICSAGSPAQERIGSWSVRAGGGLGVALVAMPRLADYVNMVSSSAEPADEFASAAELVLFGDVRITDEWSAGLFWGRIAKTIEPGGASSSGWAFDATMRMPLFIVRRSVEAVGMRLLLTGGAGPASGELTQRYGPLGSEQRFTGNGLALLGGAAAFAPLDDHIVAGMAVDVRWSGVGRLVDSNGRQPVQRGVTADMSWFLWSLQFLIAAQF